MARTALTVQQISRAGLTPAYAAANVDGHALPNTGREFFHIQTTTNACDVTLVIPGTVDGQAIGDRVVSLSTADEQMIGPFPASIYNQPGTPEVHLDFTDVTGVTIAAFRVT